MKTTLGSRDELPALLASLGALKGVEVGVAAGFYSRDLLEGSSLEVLYSIDPWDHRLPGYPTQEHAEADYNHCRKLLAPYGSRSYIIRNRAELEVANFETCSLSFVYIDSTHTFADTFTQCVLWWDKVAPGGIMAGHDYVNGVDVQLAVAAFCRHEGISLDNIETTADDKTSRDFLVNSWIIRKRPGYGVDFV
jgi:hypothetical protein